jgi:hypothetical protein
MYYSKLAIVQHYALIIAKESEEAVCEMLKEYCEESFYENYLNT